MCLGIHHQQPFYRALVNKNSYLKIKYLANPTRIGFYELLKKHGAIKFVNKRNYKNELIEI